MIYNSMQQNYLRLQAAATEHQVIASSVKSSVTIHICAVHMLSLLTFSYLCTALIRSRAREDSIVFSNPAFEWSHKKLVRCYRPQSAFLFIWHVIHNTSNVFLLYIIDVELRNMWALRSVLVLHDLLFVIHPMSFFVHIVNVELRNMWASKHALVLLGFNHLERIQMSLTSWLHCR